MGKREVRAWTLRAYSGRAALMHVANCQQL